MIWNTFLLALRAIRRNLLRSFLTILGVVIGVAAVITMVTLGDGATKAVSDQIASLGNNLLTLRPGQRLGLGFIGAPAFKVSDAEAIAQQVPGVRLAAPVASRSVTVVAGANNWTTSITGSTVDYFDVANWKLTEGRFFNESEERAGKAVCVLGETVKRELFGSQSPIGEEIRVKQFACEVIGVLAPKGQSTMGSDQDDTIVMPLRAVQRRLIGNTDVRSIMVSVVNSESMEKAKRQIEQLMRERRRLSDNEDNNFFIFDTRQVAETLTGTIRVMTTLLGAVAAVSLLVGGIGIMNIMLVSVTERTREIGIRLAIGALERDVLLQFLIEAVALSGFGGLIGILVAFGASLGLARVMQVPFLFNPSINIVAFFFASAIGAIFGFYPARRAARLNPIDALRHE
ncbi:ABC transporter permease [Pelomicrobium methylotrophicum]|uniref:FtsX-like permease family protein n=1 Tax=Pelomicrobium methylotrophicum TaxID=2602750 RepID=A0A5C7EQ19_9PROT|nr:ABC transporter permease [Pelomicrobium methylotrophicum]TXF10584.1 FtsX-like permease family protein [Pelomicrobium methylotrophicum]